MNIFLSVVIFVMVVCIIIIRVQVKRDYEDLKRINKIMEKDLNMIMKGKGKK